jgi:hypothetical protein
VLSTLTDGALLIARHGKSSRDDLEQAAHALEAVNAKLLGTVLNCIPLRAAGYSYGYGYGYAEDRSATATKKTKTKTKRARPAPRARVARNTERSEALRRRVAVPEREGGEQFQLDLDAYLQSTRRD